MKQITPSENFKKMTTKAIGSIILFIISYSFLIIFAIGLTGLLCLIAYVLIAYHMGGFTLGLSIGLVSIGVLVLIFLVKFIFKKHSNDISQLTEVTRAQQPQLFQMIDEIVSDVGTHFPKKIYLSADVNASVFYDSSIMSMFLPIKKNLNIGMGLVNTLTVSELRSVLAHEFGHFSQRTMKVGSYVYNTNRIIHNMLYDNESYDTLVEKWAGVSGYFNLFIHLAVWIIRKIQWILQKVYHHVNLNYLSLSREMEFHADEVAANVAGSAPLTSALLRMEIADQSFQTIVNHYETKADIQIFPENIYPLQTYITNFWANKNAIAIENNLPQITLEYIKRYNHSKLVISNQWASHPSTEDRVEQLIKLNIPTRDNISQPALSIFHNPEILLSNITGRLFETIDPTAKPDSQAQEFFINEFLLERKENSFHQIYNGYYDAKNPGLIDLHTSPIESESYINTPNIFFEKDIMNDIYECRSLENDISSLQQISDDSVNIQSFDYDGKKYSNHECNLLIASLQSRLKELEKKLLQNDQMIYEYCLNQEASGTDTPKLQSMYQSFSNLTISTDSKFSIYIQMVNATGFMYETTSFEIIREKLNALREIESDFKKDIENLLSDTTFHPYLTPEVTTGFNNYMHENHKYFYDKSYIKNEVDTLFLVIFHYNSILTNTHFAKKKALLEYQASLLENAPAS